MSLFSGTRDLGETNTNERLIGERLERRKGSKPLSDAYLSVLYSLLVLPIETFHVMSYRNILCLMVGLVNAVRAVRDCCASRTVIKSES